MGTTISPKIWTTFDNRQITINKLEDQHLCNCYWFSKIFYGGCNIEILNEVKLRFGDTPLPFKPLPVPKEIEALKRLRLIHGDDIVLKGEIIGSIKHLKK